jgi:hypothetical protein
MIRVFVVCNSFTVEAWLRAEYDSLSMHVSKIALEPRGWIRSIYLILLGLMFVIQVIDIAIEFKKSKILLI